jgi:hypothetical protein
MSITTIARQAQGHHAGEIIAKLAEDAYFMRVDNRVAQVPPAGNHEATSRSPADGGHNCIRGEHQPNPNCSSDRGKVPVLLVSGDNFDLVGGNPHDPTTTSETRSANAIVEPTPDGYRPWWCKISLIMKTNSCAQSKNEQEFEAGNLNITQRWSSESHRTTRICACSGIAKARCKTKLKL